MGGGKGDGKAVYGGEKVFFGADLGRLACVCLWKGLGVQATGMSGRRPQFTVSGAALSNSRPTLPAKCLTHFTSISRLPAGFSHS